MSALQRLKLDGYHVVLAELEAELDLLQAQLIRDQAMTQRMTLTNKIVHVHDVVTVLFFRVVSSNRGMYAVRVKMRDVSPQ